MLLYKVSEISRESIVYFCMADDDPQIFVSCYLVHNNNNVVYSCLCQYKHNNQQFKKGKMTRKGVKQLVAKYQVPNRIPVRAEPAGKNTTDS